MTSEELSDYVQSAYAATGATGTVNEQSIVEALGFDPVDMAIVWGYDLQDTFDDENATSAYAANFFF